MNILVLSPYAPWPPYGGGTMRIYQLIRGIAAAHHVTCLTFVADATAIDAVRAHMPTVAVHPVVGPVRRSLRHRAWQMLTSLLPDMALRNHDAHFQQQLHEILRTHTFDVAIVFSIEMAPYMHTVQQHGIPCVFDEFNAEYVIQQRAALTDMRQPNRWHAALYSFVQWQKLRRFEAQMVRYAAQVTVVSAEDAATLQRLVPTVHPVVIPNGVDTTYFDATAVHAMQFAQPTIVFSGTLDYRPNVDAVRWFATDVLPLIRARIADAALLVVGRRPTAALHAMHDAGVIALTGEVADTRPYLCGGHVYVVPMRIGGGVRLKVLEALALDLPIVSTTMGMEGIEDLPADMYVRADTPTAMADAICALLQAPRQRGNGRTFVETHYDWRVIVPRLLTVLDGVVSQTPHAGV